MSYPIPTVDPEEVNDNLPELDSDEELNLEDKEENDTI